MGEKQPITGYRKLSEDEIALINKIKAKANEVELLIRQVEMAHGTDQRWIKIGTTDLQKGFMSLTRAVCKPTSF